MTTEAHILRLSGGTTLCDLAWQEVRDSDEVTVLLGNADKATCGICREVAQRVPQSKIFDQEGADKRLGLVDICVRRRSDGKFLAVTNRKYSGWTLPGGKIDPGESPAQAAVRELREETGLRVHIEQLRGNGDYFEHVWRDMPVRCYAFYVDWSAVRDQEPIPEEEGTQVLWVTRDDLLNPSSECLASSYYGWMMAKKDW